MNTENQEQKKSETTDIIAGSEIFAGKLPDLSKAQAAPLPINGEYWTPSQIGEKRRMFFKELRTEQVIDQQSGQEVDLLVAYFVYPVDGHNTIVRQGGARLTSVFANFVNAGTIKPGMAFEITYNGKQKNKNNSFMSDTWSIVPLATA